MRLVLQSRQGDGPLHCSAPPPPLRRCHTAAVARTHLSLTAYASHAQATNHCRFCKCRGCPYCASVLRSNREQGKHTPCKSENAGDFNYRACAPFCSVEKAEGHCDFCKCSDCPYCLAGDETMATLAAAKSAAAAQLGVSAAAAPAAQPAAQPAVQPAAAAKPAVAKPAVAKAGKGAGGGKGKGGGGGAKGAGAKAAGGGGKGGGAAPKSKAAGKAHTPAGPSRRARNEQAEPVRC